MHATPHTTCISPHLWTPARFCVLGHAPMLVPGNPSDAAGREQKGRETQLKGGVFNWEFRGEGVQ